MLQAQTDCARIWAWMRRGNHDANQYLAEFCGSDANADALAELMMDAWVAFAATGSPQTEATGPWPMHDPLSRDVVRSTGLSPACSLLPLPFGPDA